MLVNKYGKLLIGLMLLVINHSIHAQVKQLNPGSLPTEIRMQEYELYHFEPGLQKLIEAAYAKNDTVRINNNRIRQMKLDQQSVKYNYLPRVFGNLTYTRLNDDIRFPSNLNSLLMGTQSILVKEAIGIPFNAKLPESIKLQSVPVVQEKNIFKATINSQWTIFSGFKVEYLSKAINHQQNSISYLNHRQRIKIIAEVSDQYDKLALLNASDSVIHSSSRVLDEQRRFVLAAISNGLATPLERKKIELAEQRIKLKILENEHNRILLSEKLSQLTGLEVKEILELNLSLLPLLVQEDMPVAQRPEIYSLNEAITATRFAEKTAYSEYIPKVALFGQYELMDHDLSMFDPRWYAGLRLQWNLFDGFTARNNAKRSALDRMNLEIQKEHAEELIRLGQTKTFQELKTAQQRIVMMQAQVAVANETLDFVSKQFKNGLTNITELLNALNEVERSRFELYQSYYLQRRAAVEFAGIHF